LLSTVDDQLYLEALKTKHKAVVLKSEFKRAPAAPVASK
jgi:hypothetical protein